MQMLRDALRDAVADARRGAVDAGDLRLPDGTDPDALPPISIERPGRAEHGDYATNAALQLAPLARAAPLAIAEALRTHIRLPDGVAESTVERPGFLNFRLDAAWLGSQVAPLRDEAWGRVRVYDPKRINVEFVSANPTGPLTVGNARGAFVGDLLCRVLEAAGHQVKREYYFNDSNTQIQNLGRSILARRRGEEVPEDGYHGAYVRDLADELPAAILNEPDPVASASRWASERVRAGIEASLERLGVRFDVWQSEASVYAGGWVERGMEHLRASGYLYEEGGATWFRATAFGDGKDRVVYRSNGQPTYFAADIGYISEKFSRGFDQLIYVWGADHHGTVARNRAAAQALGHDASAVHWLLIAWVRFVRDGQEMSMSKRAGEFVTLDELLAEIGVDAARWFFGARATTSGIDFDIELAKRQSSENPVYYVQYAHARSASILRNAAAASVAPDPSAAAELLRHPAEQALIRELLRLPEVVADSAERRETHDVPRYAHDVATLFNQFYRDCRVLTDDPRLSGARLALVDASRQVLANTLGLLGISAPDAM